MSEDVPAEPLDTASIELAAAPFASLNAIVSVAISP